MIKKGQFLIYEKISPTKKTNNPSVFIVIVSIKIYIKCFWCVFILLRAVYLALLTKVDCFFCLFGLLIFKKESEGDFRKGIFITLFLFC